MHLYRPYVTGFVKRGLTHTNNIQKYHCEIFNSCYLNNAWSHGASCTQFSTNLQLYKSIHCMYSTMDNQLNCLPFQIVTNTTSALYEVVGWGLWGAMEWRAKQHVMHLYFLQASTKSHRCSKYHKKQLNHWTISLASCVEIYSHVQLRLWSAEPTTHNWSTHGCLAQLVNQPQQKQTEQVGTNFRTSIVCGEVIKTHNIAYYQLVRSVPKPLHSAIKQMSCISGPQFTIGALCWCHLVIHDFYRPVKQPPGKAD